MISSAVDYGSNSIHEETYKRNYNVLWKTEKT